MSEQPSQPPEILPPPWQMMQLLWPSPMVVQAIHVAATLGIADFLSTGPRNVEELAEATGSNPAALERLLRALTSLAIFERDPSGRFGPTALSETLRSGQPQSMKAWGVLTGHPLFWRPIGELMHTITTGEPAFDAVFGQSFFRHLNDHADDAAAYNAAMGSGLGVAEIVAAYDFSRFERIVDVGGGHGALLNAVLAASPRSKGILFDLPGVIGNASRGPAELVVGDFFESVPAGADAYILKSVIHDWDDASAVRILKSCRRACGSHSTLLLIEKVLTGESDPVGAFMDLLMMVLVRGRERTEQEFRTLLQEAGFTATRVVATTTGASIIECRQWVG